MKSTSYYDGWAGDSGVDIDDEIRLNPKRKEMAWTNKDLSRFQEFMNQTGFRVKQNDNMYEDINSIDKSQPFTFLGRRHTIQ